MDRPGHLPRTGRPYCSRSHPPCSRSVVAEGRGLEWSFGGLGPLPRRPAPPFALVDGPRLHQTEARGPEATCLIGLAPCFHDRLLGRICLCPGVRTCLRQEGGSPLPSRVLIRRRWDTDLSGSPLPSHRISTGHSVPHSCFARSADKPPLPANGYFLCYQPGISTITCVRSAEPQQGPKRRGISRTFGCSFPESLQRGSRSHRTTRQSGNHIKSRIKSERTAGVTRNRGLRGGCLPR